ncbi:hypothetical protein FIM1_4052 [Kluyveromyces marxianus]|uniref:Secreted protein n=1 Tax=Kluyveromyces marxianus TaxID=4911 RepID=A0ABX6F0G0_KLUMA|nr:hypothetical protein FIM1_4052 [Kluyveromyces marxianus]
MQWARGNPGLGWLALDCSRGPLAGSYGIRGSTLAAGGLLSLSLSFLWPLACCHRPCSPLFPLPRKRRDPSKLRDTIPVRREGCRGLVRTSLSGSKHAPFFFPPPSPFRTFLRCATGCLHWWVEKEVGRLRHRFRHRISAVLLDQLSCFSSLSHKPRA